MHGLGFGWFRLVLLLSALLASGCIYRASVGPQGRPISLDAVPVVYSLGPQHHDHIKLSPEDWAKIKGLFVPPPQTDLEERHRIRYAVAYLEQIAGQQTPMKYDLAMNQRNPAGPGMLDCVDESTNTGTFLRLLQERGLMRRHVTARFGVRAGHIWDIHQTAVIRSLKTGIEYVVDSWFLDNGYPPYVQQLADWYKERPFPYRENPIIDVGLSNDNLPGLPKTTVTLHHQ